MSTKTTKKTASKKHGHHHPSFPAARRRLARIAGHVEAIERMVVDERDCTDILQQIRAVTAALTSVRRVILQDHIHHCLAHAVESRRPQDVVREIERLLAQVA